LSSTLFVAFVAFCSGLIGTGQDQPRKPIDEPDLMNVEHEPERSIEEFHGTEKSGTEGNKGNKAHQAGCHQSRATRWR
jgi:hypothetical protein